jgi:hypothetical protein
MKKLIVLLSIMMLQLTAFSQVDTDTIPVKTLPISTLKNIIKDVVVGDSAIAELKLTQEELRLSNETVIESRKIINEYKLKYSICEEVIRLEKEKYLIIEKYSNRLQDDLRKERMNNKLIKIGSGGVIVLLVTAIIFK